MVSLGNVAAATTPNTTSLLAHYRKRQCAGFRPQDIPELPEFPTAHENTRMKRKANSVSLYHMFDAAYPPSSQYPGTQAVAGYIGGNTPHVWTSAEWQRFGHLRQFPIWTGYAEANPTDHGQQAVAAMHKLGWAAGRPNRRAVIVDEETEVDAAWIDAFAAVIWDAGYQTFIYGSLATVLKNPPKEGYLIADWNDVPTVPPYAHVIGHQYKPNVSWDGTEVDLSVIAEEMFVHGGEGPRK